MPRNVNCIYINQQTNDCKHPKKKKRFGIFNCRCFVWVNECAEEECDLNKKFAPSIMSYHRNDLVNENANTISHSKTLTNKNTIEITYNKDYERTIFVKKHVVANSDLMETSSSVKEVLNILSNSKVDKIFTSPLVFMFLKLYYENPNKKNHILYNAKVIKIQKDEFATEDYIGWEEN